MSIERVELGLGYWTTEAHPTFREQHTPTIIHTLSDARTTTNTRATPPPSSPFSCIVQTARALRIWCLRLSQLVIRSPESSSPHFQKVLTTKARHKPLLPAYDMSKHSLVSPEHSLDFPRNLGCAHESHPRQPAVCVLPRECRRSLAQLVRELFLSERRDFRDHATAVRRLRRLPACRRSGRRSGSGRRREYSPPAF